MKKDAWQPLSRHNVFKNQLLEDLSQWTVIYERGAGGIRTSIEVETERLISRDETVLLRLSNG